MKKIILIWILIIIDIVLVIIIGCVIIWLVLMDGSISEKSIKKSVPPQTSNQTPAPTQVSKEVTYPPQPKPIPALGIYEVCSEVKGCNPEIGINKIKEIGAEAVIVTVVDAEDLKAVTYYPSKYLPLAKGIPDDYLKRIVESAHKNNIKVYALINIPHNYWLLRHPDWIAVLSNGQPADTYEKDYFHRIVPPSRVIAEEECRELLKDIINEIVSYGVDGIDINDNFQFSDQYLERTDTILFTSYDDFTIEKFEKEMNTTIQGDSPKEWAEYIKDNSDIYTSWLEWRAEQVTKLFKILKQTIKDIGVDIPLRPHLLTYGYPYEYYGLDYEGIAKEVDVLYLMITPEQPKEKYFAIIKSTQDSQPQRIAVSTYLFRKENNLAVERNKEKILERMRWISDAGADEIYVYNFRLIEEGNHWLTVKKAFEEVNGEVEK